MKKLTIITIVLLIIIMLPISSFAAENLNKLDLNAEVGPIAVGIVNHPQEIKTIGDGKLRKWKETLNKEIQENRYICSECT